MRLYNPILSYTYYRDRFIKINLFLGVFLNISLWLGLAWQVKYLSGLIGLHYNIYFGIDLLGAWYKIFLLPGLGLLFLAVNFLAGLVVFEKEKILSYFLAGASSFIQIILVLSAVFIILVNL